MPTYYVSKSGNDLTGDGSQTSPFASLEHALGLTLDEVTLIDSTLIYIMEGIYDITQSLNPDPVQNLAVRAYPGADVTLNRAFDSGPLFEITELPRFRLADLTISSDYDFETLIKITNSNLAEVFNITIKDIDIQSPTHATKSVFSFLNTHSYMGFCKVTDCSFPAQDVVIIDQVNASNVTYEHSSISNISAKNVKGFYCRPGNLVATLDTIDFNNLTAEVSSVGVDLAFATNTIDILLDNFIIHHVGIGIRLQNNLSSHTDHVRLRRGEIYEALEGVNSIASGAKLYNCVIANCTQGIFARTSSRLNTFNNILYNNSVALRAVESSEIRVNYTALYSNDSDFEESGAGVIFRQEFVRFINPKFVDADNYDFQLMEDSPLIDIGTDVDYSVEGTAVDIGKYDIDRLIPPTELEALTAKLVTRTYRPEILGSIDAQALLADIIADVAPEVNVREGSAVNDLLVKPHALLYQRFINSFMVMARNQSVLAAEFMSMDELDAFAANHYVERIQGSLALATVRIYVTEPIALVITPEDIFTAEGNRRYYSRQYIQISSGEMLFNREGELFFVDVPVEAETFGSEYNVTSGDINTWLGAPDVVSYVSNPNDGVDARDVEDNEDLIRRTVFSIGNRSLVNALGISAILREEFPELVRVVPIGAGDPEMKRDILAGFHVYGKTDIYISAIDVTTNFIDILNVSEETILNRTSMGNLPLLDILSIEIVDPVTGEPTGVILSPTDYQLISENPDDRFSAHESLKLQLIPEVTGTDIRMTFRWSPQILTVENFCQSDEARVLCEDVRIKHLVPVFISFNVNYKAMGTLDEDKIITELKDWVNNFQPEEEFHVSDIIDTLYRHGADFVEQPLMVEATYMHQDGSVETQFFKNINTIPRIYGYLADQITLTKLP